MPRRPDMPCAECGKLIWRSSTSLPSGEARCQQCRRVRPVHADERRYAKVCAACGGEFLTAKRAARYCCLVPCALARYGDGPKGPQTRDALKRARFYGVEYERIRSADIFERDGWRCHLCGKKCHKKPVVHGGYDPLSATLDHLIPMSLGGPHLRTNVACAHMRCNQSKGATGDGDQLLLIG